MDLNVFGWMASQPNVNPLEARSEPAKILAKQPGYKRKPRITTEEYEEIKQRLAECGNMAQVAREFDVSERWLLEIKKRIQKGLDLPENQDPIPEQKADNLIGLVAKGKTVRQAAAEAGLTYRQGWTLVCRLVPEGVTELRKQYAEKL